MTSHLLSKSLKYKIAGRLFQEGGDFLLQENGDKFLIEYQTTLTSVQKSLRYTVYNFGSAYICYGDHPLYGNHPCYGPLGHLSKLLKYTVYVTHAPITKSLTYKLTNSLLQENGDLLLQENGDRITIEYLTTYGLFTKSLKYYIYRTNSLAKSLVYHVITPNWNPELREHSDWSEESKSNSVWLNQVKP